MKHICSETGKHHSFLIIYHGMKQQCNHIVNENNYTCNKENLQFHLYEASPVTYSGS